MADVLSQSQIDALLNSMQNSGAEEVEEEPKVVEKEYKKYDFFSPKKYTKDKLYFADQRSVPCGERSRSYGSRRAEILRIRECAE